MIQSSDYADFCVVKWGQRGSRNTDVCSNAKTNIALQLKYKKDLNKMKGTSHFHSLTSEDNLTLKNARKINKIISEVSLLFPADSQPTSVNPDRIFPQAQCSPVCVCVFKSTNIKDTVSVSKRHETTQRAFLPPLTCLSSTVTDYVQGLNSITSN